MNEGMTRRQAMEAKRRSLIIFGIFVVILLTVVCQYKYEHTYSRAKWDRDRENRCKIVYNMLERNQLTGMTEAEVIRLLGDEDGGGQTSFKISRRYFPPGSTLVYYLGIEFVDSKWLVISLEGGVVTEYCIDVT